MQITKDLKRYFFRGLAALLPTLLTIWIFVQFYAFVQENISVHINRGLVRVIVFSYGRYIDVTDEQIESYLKKNESALFEPGQEQELAKRRAEAELLQKIRVTKLDGFWVRGRGRIAGFIVALFAVFVFGVLLASVVGKTVWRIF